MSAPQPLAADTTRGRIRGFLERNAGLLRPRVLEVGARIPHKTAWWADHRTLRPELAADWYGVDSEGGPGVDLVCDAAELPPSLTWQFSSAVCAETLEHVHEPLRVLRAIFRTLKPGSPLLVTTLCAFMEHSYPVDCWRFMPDGMDWMLHESGYQNIEIETAGQLSAQLSDHGEPPQTIASPVHIFALAWTP